MPLRVLIVSFLMASLSAVAVAAQTTPAPVPASASTPRVIRLDGTFRPANGQPASAIEVMTLAIYASASDQTPLWQETQQVAIDANGRYVVYLGATSAEGLPAALLTGDELRWLGLRVERPGEPETPRTVLTSVPYAIRAAQADTLGGFPASAFVRADDGGADPGAIRRPAAGLDSPSVNSGTVNYIGKFTNSVDLGNSVMFENAGRIGIGTTQPFDVLHSRFTNNDGSLTGLAVQNLGSSAASYSGMLFYDQNGNLGQFQGFNNLTHEYRINNIASGATINFMTGSTSRFLVRSDGDIEISGNLRKAGVLFLHDLGGLSVAVGGTALSNGSNSAQNVAVGYGALNTTTGSGNVALGWGAGASRTSGDFNIYIGAGVGFGTGTESNTMRLGDGGGILRTFVGGVRGVTTQAANAVAVMIDSAGNLGTVNSSRRYKQDIQDMGEASSGLMRLRPVTYRYAQPYADGSTPIDYGLIAEEVEEVYPDLVAHLQNGDVETVQYHKINAMLLNEVQKQHRQIEQQRREMDALMARLAALEQHVSGGSAIAPRSPRR